MSIVIGRRQIKSGPRIAICALLLAGTASVVPLPFTASPALAKPPLPTTEVWPGRRVVFLLPLQLSDNWNADPVWGKRLLGPAEQRLRSALENTGKFSVVQPYQFDPILQRAVQEKRIDKAQLDTMIDTPNLQTASGVLDKLGFPLPPLIAEFRLEEVRSSGDAKAPSVQMQVLGKLHALNSQEAETKVFTSDPIRRRGSQFDQTLDAAANAFQMVANDFVRPPAEIELPRVDPPATPEKPAGKGKPAAPAKNGKTTPKPVAPAPGVAPGTGETPAPAPVTPPVTPPVPPVIVPATPPPTVIGPAPQGPVQPQFNGQNSGGQVQRAP